MEGVDPRLGGVFTSSAPEGPVVRGTQRLTRKGTENRLLTTPQWDPVHRYPQRCVGKQGVCLGTSMSEWQVNGPTDPSVNGN